MEKRNIININKEHCTFFLDHGQHFIYFFGWLMETLGFVFKRRSLNPQPRVCIERKTIRLNSRLIDSFQFLGPDNQSKKNVFVDQSEK